MTPRTQRIVYGFLAGTFGGLAWLSVYFTPLMILLPVFAARSIRTAQNTRQALWAGFWIGVFMYAVASHFLLWLMRYSPLGFVFYLMAIAYVVPYALFEGWLAHRLFKRTRIAPGFWLGCGWALMDFLRARGDLSFPADLMPHGLGAWPASIRWSSLTGPTWVVFWLFCAGALIEMGWHRGWRNGRNYVVAGLTLWIAPFLVGTLLTHSDQPDEDVIRVGIVQPAITAEEKLNPEKRKLIWQRLEELTREAAKGSDLVVWPESSRPGRIEWEGADSPNDPDVQRISARVGVPILYGTELVHVTNRANGQFKLYNGAALVWPDDQNFQWYGKQRLLPFAEGVPFAEFFGLDAASRVRSSGGRKSYLTLLGLFSPGPTPTIFEIGSVRVGVLICYEGFYASLANTYRRNGANALAVLTNDAWWGRSGFPAWHSRMIATRAIENDLPVIRAANDGISSSTGRDGRYRDAMPLDERGVLHTTLRVNDSGPTLFARTGDWAPIGILLILVLGWFSKRIRGPVDA